MPNPETPYTINGPKDQGTKQIWGQTSSFQIFHLNTCICIVIGGTSSAAVSGSGGVSRQLQQSTGSSASSYKTNQQINPVVLGECNFLNVVFLNYHKSYSSALFSPHLLLVVANFRSSLAHQISIYICYHGEIPKKLKIY